MSHTKYTLHFTFLASTLHPASFLKSYLQGAVIKIRNTCFHRNSASYPQSTIRSIPLSEQTAIIFLTALTGWPFQTRCFLFTVL